jgi:hypothetical protein
MKISVSTASRYMITLCAVISIIFAVAGTLQATTIYSYDVSPADLAGENTFLNGQGGVMFGYDPDMPAPEGSSVAGPTSFGNSCFYSDVQGSAAGGSRAYTSIRMSLKDMFGLTDVTIKDLASISYYTKLESGVDWQLKIYTEDETAPIGWYQTRFNWSRATPTDSEWHLYSTDDLALGTIQVKETGYKSTTGLGSLSTLDALYGSEKVLFVEIIASFATASPASYSYLDGITITLDSGDKAVVNLVPEPSTVTLLILAAMGMLVFARRAK